MKHTNVLDFVDKSDRNWCFYFANFGIIFIGASAQLFRQRRMSNSAGSEVTHQPMAVEINRCRVKILIKCDYTVIVQSETNQSWHTFQEIYTQCALCCLLQCIRGCLNIKTVFLGHDDVIKWKHIPRNWPFVRGIHRSRWIPHTKASDAELWCFLSSASEYTVK